MLPSLKRIRRQQKLSVSGRYSSFIEFHGQQLLDLSLYVSIDNYNSSTRPEYAKILQWPQQWFIPSQLRTAAKTRTEHLDIFSLDLDSIGKEPPRNRNFGQDLIPKSLRSSRQTLSSLLQQTQQTSRFRLEALAEAVFNPLEQLLGKKRYMLSNKEPSNLDYLAFAYLALALIPVVPQPWLTETMRAKHPALCSYVENLMQEFFHGPTNVDRALPYRELRSRHPELFSRYSLPWSPSPQNGTMSAISTLISHAFGSLSPLDDPRIIKKKDMPSEDKQRQFSSTVNSGKLPAVVALASGLVAVCSYLIYSKVAKFSSSGTKSKPRSLADLGEAGAMLSFLDSEIPEPRKTDMVPVAEVAVTADNGANK